MIKSQHKRVMDEIERCCRAAGAKFVAKELAAMENKDCVEDVNFQKGHRLEVVNTIKEMDKDPNLRKLKFPMFALFTDITVQYNRYPDYDGVTLSMVIAHRTEKDYNTAEREVYVFQPFLRPLFNYFAAELYSSSIFAITDEDKDIKLAGTERFYWGKTGLYGNVGGIFQEYVDAIELNNLDLKIHKIC